MVVASVFVACSAPSVSNPPDMVQPADELPTITNVAQPNECGSVPVPYRSGLYNSFDDISIYYYNRVEYGTVKKNLSEVGIDYDFEIDRCKLETDLYRIQVHIYGDFDPEALADALTKLENVEKAIAHRRTPPQNITENEFVLVTVKRYSEINDFIVPTEDAHLYETENVLRIVPVEILSSSNQFYCGSSAFEGSPVAGYVKNQLFFEYEQELANPVATISNIARTAGLKFDSLEIFKDVHNYACTDVERYYTRGDYIYTVNLPSNVYRVKFTGENDTITEPPFGVGQTPLIVKPAFQTDDYRRALWELVQNPDFLIQGIKFHTRGGINPKSTEVFGGGGLQGLYSDDIVWLR